MSVRSSIRGTFTPWFATMVGAASEAIGYLKSDLIPPILSDGNTVAWFDYLENVTKDGSDFVSVWGDKSGNTNDLLQAVGTNQPLWVDGDGILFDGIDNFLKTVDFTYEQPEQIYIVLKQISWTASDVFFDGSTNDDGWVAQSGSSPDLKAYGGTVSSVNDNLVINTLGIIRVLFDGVSSKFQINNTTAITGDFGSLDMGGIALGSQGGGSAGFSNILVMEGIFRKIADVTQDEADIYNYLAAKYGIS